ncbi:hypothetical protein FRC03_006169 [Tulasnella sp. 419]|nr:hypothetical protein FRC03_006169 [Tulasnella sp. 419]
MLEAAAQTPSSGPLDSSLSPYQAGIVSRCAAAVQTAMLLFNDCVVKFKDVNILNEGETQVFVYAAALESSPNAPRFPEVYTCFSWDRV